MSRRICLTQTGARFAAWRRNRSIERARRLLANESRPVIINIESSAVGDPQAVAREIGKHLREQRRQP